MRHKIGISLSLLLLTAALFAQSPGPGGQQEKKPIRIVDTLTPAEKIQRNPVILKSELDSMIQQFIASQPVTTLKEPVPEKQDNFSYYILAALGLMLLLIGFLIYLVYKHQKKVKYAIANLNHQGNHEGPGSVATGLPTIKRFTDMAKEKTGKSRVTPQTLENKINDLNAELHKLTKENEGLNRVIREYNGIQHEYETLKHGIARAYKIKNYPGYDKSKTEPSILKGVLETESSVANYAYEKFLKPVFAITDANKNNPARISDEDQAKLLELLISLSLLYIEYLYLRVNDLSIGGKMVERIQGLSAGNGLDQALLKKLNTEHGSRALVLRMVLDKSELFKLSYPVFDETNLNNQ